MKKTLFIGFIMILALFGCDLFNSEHNPKDTTVAGAKNQRDGTYVRISGQITSEITHEWYTFSDHTGAINIEIENEVWGRSGVNPNSLTFPLPVEIIGEVDKERAQQTTIEVESIKILH